MGIQVHEILQYREKNMHSDEPGDVGFHVIVTFDQFWISNCKVLSDAVTLLFYFGTLTLLIAVMIFMWSEFVLSYKDQAPGIIAVVIIGISIFIAIYLVIWIYTAPNAGIIHNPNTVLRV